MSVFVVVSVGELTLSVLALLWSTANSSAAFEGNQPSVAALYAARAMLAVTWSPVSFFKLSPNYFSGLLGWVPVVANSLLWGALASLAYRWWNDRSRGKSPGF